MDFGDGNPRKVAKKCRKVRLMTQKSARIGEVKESKARAKRRGKVRMSENEKNV